MTRYRYSDYRSLLSLFESTRASVIEALLGGYIDVNAKDYLGNTALHYACSRGEDAVAAILLKKAGAAIDACYDYGQTAFHLAVQRMRSDTVQLLLSKGATV